MNIKADLFDFLTREYRAENQKMIDSGQPNFSCILMSLDAFGVANQCARTDPIVDFVNWHQLFWRKFSGCGFAQDRWFLHDKNLALFNFAEPIPFLRIMTTLKRVVTHRLLSTAPQGWIRVDSKFPTLNNFNRLKTPVDMSKAPEQNEFIWIRTYKDKTDLEAKGKAFQAEVAKSGIKLGSNVAKMEVREVESAFA